MLHLHSEYFQRMDQSSLDVHFICEELTKLATMIEAKEIKEEDVTRINASIASWMISQESKFKTKELQIKAIKEVKWFSRTNFFEQRARNRSAFKKIM